MTHIMFWYLGANLNELDHFLSLSFVYAYKYYGAMTFGRFSHKVFMKPSIESWGIGVVRIVSQYEDFILNI